MMGAVKLHRHHTHGSGEAIRLPWVPPGRTVLVPGRGEVFVRWHRHADPTRPTLLLLHGWTASADLQFFTAYQTLAEHYSFVAVDHHGHGRGVRTPAMYELEHAADDAAAVVRELGVGPVITIGYSMGGPISMLLARRHPELVRGVIVQATALEWRDTRFERVRWRTIRLMGPLLRSWAYPRSLRYALLRLVGADEEMAPFVPWLESEIRRGDTQTIVQAGRALARYDARPWASGLGVPAGALITSRDRLVWPHKQRALAEALRAHVVEVDGDHLVTIEDAPTYRAATLALVDHLTGRLADAAPGTTAPAAAQAS